MATAFGPAVKRIGDEHFGDRVRGQRLWNHRRLLLKVWSAPRIDGANPSAFAPQFIRKPSHSALGVEAAALHKLKPTNFSRGFNGRPAERGAGANEHSRPSIGDRAGDGIQPETPLPTVHPIHDRPNHLAPASFDRYRQGRQPGLFPPSLDPTCAMSAIHRSACLSQALCAGLASDQCCGSASLLVPERRASLHLREGRQ